MDDVRIYSRALSFEEIRKQYYSEVSSQKPSPQGGRDADARSGDPKSEPSGSERVQSDLSTQPSTFGLVLRLDFTAMHNQMEKIIAEAGPEEPYRSRFAASQTEKTQKTEDQRP
jgi:hypothetical protein